MTNHRYIAGVDEVGRGPWAGPVMAAAAVFEPTFFEQEMPDVLRAVTDSKKLTLAKRETLFDVIREYAYVGIGEASVEEIDRVNIRQATFLAMQRAVEALPVTPEHALIDGNAVPPHLPCTAEAIVKGDGKIFQISCASIIAKVTRDRLMGKLAEEHPYYGWESNAGYGTAAHQSGLAVHGVTVHHRRSFAPIRGYLEKSS